MMSRNLSERIQTEEFYLSLIILILFFIGVYINLMITVFCMIFVIYVLLCIINNREYIKNKLSENTNISDFNCTLLLNDWISIIDNEISENSIKGILLIKTSLLSVILAPIMFFKDDFSWSSFVSVLETIGEFITTLSSINTLLFIVLISTAIYPFTCTYFIDPNYRRVKLKELKRKIILGELINSNNIRKEYLKIEDKELRNVFQAWHVAIFNILHIIRPELALKIEYHFNKHILKRM